MQLKQIILDFFSGDFSQTKGTDNCSLNLIIRSFVTLYRLVWSHFNEHSSSVQLIRTPSLPDISVSARNGEREEKSCPCPNQRRLCQPHKHPWGCLCLRQGSRSRGPSSLDLCGFCFSSPCHLFHLQYLDTVERTTGSSLLILTACDLIKEKI